MVYVGAIAAIAGVGISAYGMYSQGQSAKKAGEANATLYEQEAAVSQQNAVLTEAQQRKQLRYDVGTMRGGYAKAGVSVSTGSPLDAIADSIANAELDIQINKYNAKATEEYKKSQARLSRVYGADAARTANMQATGTLLQGVGSTASRFGNERTPAKTKVGE
jgi:flagellar capping protein FliD